jgi:signal transduction histidine kinase
MSEDREEETAEVGGLLPDGGDGACRPDEPADAVSAVFDRLRSGELDLDEAERELREVTVETPAPSFGLDSLLDSVPIAAFAIDTDHRILAYNQGTANHLGLDPVEALGEDCRTIAAERTYQNSDRELTLADKVAEAPFEADEVYDVERTVEPRHGDTPVYRDRSTMVNARGEEVPIGFTAVPVVEGGEPVAVLEFFEERSERLEEFPGLAGTVSHDIRNPLGVAQSTLEMAADDLPEPHYDRLRRNLDRIEGIIDDVMTLARSADGPESREQLRLDDLGTRVWRRLDTGEATLETEAVTVEADRDQLARLLENLFQNALRHASTPGDPVAVRVGPSEAGFVVADDGPGIPPENREAVFTHGFSTESDGTGFGLPIVHSIAETHGWSVALAESESGGARFTFDTGNA